MGRVRLVSKQRHNNKENAFINSEIIKLDKSNCIKQVEDIPHGVSPINVVPKKSSGHKLMIDLRYLNSTVNVDQWSIRTFDT